MRFDILLVEDNEDHAFIIDRHLRAVVPGLTCRRSASAELALEQLALACEPPAMALIDLSMTGMGGLALIENLSARRKAVGEISRMPIFALTSSDSQDDESAVMRAGADGYFCKPASGEQFRELLCAIVRKAHEISTART